MKKILQIYEIFKPLLLATLSLAFFLIMTWSYFADNMIGVVFWGILLLQVQLEELEPITNQNKTT